MFRLKNGLILLSILIQAAVALNAGQKSEERPRFKGELTNVRTKRINAAMVGWREFEPSNPLGEPRYYTQADLGGQSYEHQYNVEFPCDEELPPLESHLKWDDTHLGETTLSITAVDVGSSQGDGFDIGRAYATTSSYLSSTEVSSGECYEGYLFENEVPIDHQYPLDEWAKEVISPTRKQWKNKNGFELFLSATGSDWQSTSDSSTGSELSGSRFYRSGYDCVAVNWCSETKYVKAEATIEFLDNTYVQLSIPDNETLALEETRSETVMVTPPSELWRKTLRTRRTDRDFFDQKTTVDAEFNVCPGTYEIRMKLKKEKWGDPTYTPTYKDVSRMVTFDESKRLPNGNFVERDFVIEAFDSANMPGPIADDPEAYSVEGYVYSAVEVFPNLGEVVAIPLTGGCSSGACGSGASAPGLGSVQNGCVEFLVNLGSGADGLSGSFLRLERDNISSEIISPNALELLTGGAYPARTIWVDDTLRQVIASDVMVNILPVSDGYEMSFYWANQAQPGASERDPYTFTGDRFAVWRVVRPADSGNNRYLRITRGEGASAVQYLFTQATQGTPSLFSDDNWSLDEGGLRTELETFGPAPGGDRYITTTRSDAAFGVAEVRRVRLHTFEGWGESIIEETLDPAGSQPLTTSYTYHLSAPGLGLRHTTTRPDGVVEIQTYTDEVSVLGGTVSKSLETITTYPGGQVRTTTHGTLPDQADDTDSSDEKLVTTTETLGGQLIKRSWQVTFSSETTFGGVSWSEHRSIEAASAGALWSDSSNLVTITRQRTATNGKLELVHSPDGTLSRTFVGLPNSSGEVTTIREDGEADSAGLLVVSGNRVSEVRDTRRHIISTTATDITSSVLWSSEATEYNDFGNPEVIAYLDGSEETLTYSSCCGRLESSTRHGITTSHTYDALGRRHTTTHAGLVIRETVDAADRVRLTERYPVSSPSTILPVSSATYDPAGRLTASADARNRVTTQVQTITPATGIISTVTTLPYDSAWPVAERGTRIETRRADGLPLSVTGTASAPVRYVYGTEILADASQWGYGAGDQFAYTLEIKLDSAGADTAETVKTYRDFLGRDIKTLHADGAASRRFYNAKGQLVRQTDPDGVQTLYAYNARGERTVTALDLDAPGTSGHGVINYTGQDRITRSQTSFATRGAIPVRRTTTEVWDANNMDTPLTVASVDVSADGLQTWQTSYDQTTRRQITYNNSNRTRSEVTTAPDNSSLIRTYLDERLVGEERKDGATSPAVLSQISYGYDSFGRLQTRNQTGVGITQYDYYADDQILSVTTPDPDTTRSGSGYDPQVTAYHYDAAGRIDDTTLPDGTHSYTTYWPTGQAKRTWGSRTYPSEYTYDAQGRVKTLTSWKDFAGATGSALTTWTYHPQRGWLTSKTYAGATAGPSYEYWPSGRLRVRTWARGLATTYTYNTAGDLWTVVYSGASPATPSVTTTYDRLGRPETTTDAAGTLSRSYEEGRLDTESYSGGLFDGRGIHREIDAYNRPASLTAGFTTLTYGYDSAGRLLTIASGIGGYETHAATLSYKPMVGTLESVSISANGVTGFNSTRSTDQLGRVGSLVVGNSSASIASRTYTYDAANQRTLVEHEDSLRWAYGYDGLGQVTSAVKRQSSGATLPGYDFGFVFDDIGNRKSATTNGRLANYTSDALNRYLSRGTPLIADVRGSAASAAAVLVNDELATRTGSHFYRAVPVAGLAENAIKIQAATVSPQNAATENRSVLIPPAPEIFSYDADGNLTQDGLWNYTWDGENRLVSQELRPEVVTTAFKRLEFVYDGQGRRVQKMVKTRVNSSAAWAVLSYTRFLYDGWNLIAEYDGLQNFFLSRSHVWGPDLSGTSQGAGGVGGLLWSLVLSTGKTYAAAADANGNVFAYVDLADGSIAGRRDYGAFGEPVTTTGVAASLPFGFSTKYEDKETGLLYYGFRYYNPSTGRWLSRDPIAERGGVNLYNFVENDPINGTDYLGLKCTDGSCSASNILKTTRTDSIQTKRFSFRQGIDDGLNIVDLAGQIRDIIGSETLVDLVVNGRGLIDQYEKTVESLNRIAGYRDASRWPLVGNLYAAKGADIHSCCDTALKVKQVHIAFRSGNQGKSDYQMEITEQTRFDMIWMPAADFKQYEKISDKEVASFKVDALIKKYAWCKKTADQVIIENNFMLGE